MSSSNANTNPTAHYEDLSLNEEVFCPFCGEEVEKESFAPHFYSCRSAQKMQNEGDLKAFDGFINKVVIGNASCDDVQDFNCRAKAYYGKINACSTSRKKTMDETEYYTDYNESLSSSFSSHLSSSKSKIKNSLAYLRVLAKEELEGKKVFTL